MFSKCHSVTTVSGKIFQCMHIVKYNITGADKRYLIGLDCYFFNVFIPINIFYIEL